MRSCGPGMAVSGLRRGCRGCRWRRCGPRYGRLQARQRSERRPVAKRAESVFASADTVVGLSDTVCTRAGRVGAIAQRPRRDSLIRAPWLTRDPSSRIRGRGHAQAESGRFYSGSVLVHVEPGRVPSWVRTLAYRVRAHVFGACGEAYRACALCEASLLRRTGSPRDRLSGLLARIRSPRGRRRSQLALRRRPLTSMRRQRRRIRGPRA